MKQHYFVVSFDETTKAWKWDTDVEEARFDEGTIFENDQWHSAYLGDGEYEPAEDELIGQLKHAINIMNLVNGAPIEGEE